ncbi:DUF3159 domain-containing protein [Catenuloplanes indicus]|uniref:DUF3159 domain-containing protein n=1 Tax=Catenuloplanes indicus TaxID=137267 RepID=A0AAE3W6W4_9ACTN|nr:DUF3159 domain-containing protein [Catenuloplanes indicus]MDQ0370430.1 hypothetical protein [Catenuloplanes indicus]
MSTRFDELWERAGGFAGLVQSSLPPVALVAANGLWGLHPAIAVAAGVALAVAVWRAFRGQSLRPAAGGLAGVVIAGSLAARSGEARDFFLADIAWYGVAAVLLAISIMVRRPLVGVLWSVLRGAGPSWRHDPVSLHGYDLATAVLAAVFATRFAVLYRFYAQDEVGWLTVSKILLNHPLWALAIWAARRSDRRLAYCTT